MPKAKLKSDDDERNTRLSCKARLPNLNCASAWATFGGD